MESTQVVCFILVAVFVYEVVLSFSLWFRLDVTVNVDTINEELIEFPKFTIMKLEYDAHVEDPEAPLDEFYHSLPSVDNSLLLDIHYEYPVHFQGKFKSEENILPNVTESLKEGAKAWTTSEHGIVNKYVTVTSPEKIQPIVGSRFNIVLNATSAYFILILLHNEEAMLPYPIAIAGSYPILVTPADKAGKFRKCGVLSEITRKIVHRISTENSPCHDEYDFHTCIDRFMSDEMKCRMPWRSEFDDLPSCNQKGTLMKFWNMSTELYEMSLKEINEKTGCSPPCNYRAYDVVTRADFCKHELAPGENADLRWMASFFYLGQSTPIERQVKSYTGSNFVADVGGYLGLLLGVSLYSGYAALVEKAKTSRLWPTTEQRAMISTKN